MREIKVPGAQMCSIEVEEIRQGLNILELNPDEDVLEAN